MPTFTIADLEGMRNRRNCNVTNTMHRSARNPSANVQICAAGVVPISRMAPTESVEDRRESFDEPPAKRMALGVPEDTETPLAQLYAEAQAADRLLLSSASGAPLENEGPETLNSLEEEADQESDNEAETLVEQQETLRLLAIQTYESALAAANAELEACSSPTEKPSTTNSSETRWIQASSLLRLGTLVPLPKYLEDSIQEFESLAKDYPTFASGLPDLYLSLGRAWFELFKLQVEAEDEADSSAIASSSKSLSSSPNGHPLERIHQAYSKAFESAKTSSPTETAVSRIARVKDILEVVELDQTRDEENESKKCDTEITANALSWALDLIQDIQPDSPDFDSLLRGRLMFRLGSTFEDLEWIDKGIKELESGLSGAEKAFETASGAHTESARVELADWIYTVRLFLYHASGTLKSLHSHLKY